MITLLAPGDAVRLVGRGTTVTVDRFLGGGGQGEVYVARTGPADGAAEYALKWYFPRSATRAQRGNLQRLVDQGPPDDRFLWPLDLATSRQRDGFGYLMPLRPARFHGMADLMTDEVSPSFQTLALTGLALADSFLQLHAAGCCYRDISFGNVFFDPTTGEVLVCDNDNVGVDDGGSAVISGTLGFMAPEVMRGETGPSAATDLYSLAVLLFHVFLVAHPLHGLRECAEPVLDEAALYRLYAADPVFVFDPVDRSNAPVPGVHDNLFTYWPLYPQFLRDLFTRAFTRGLHEPYERVRESEWRLAMVRLHDTAVYCGECGEECFWDEAATAGPTCWGCGGRVEVPPRLVVGGCPVVLNHDRRLYGHHLGRRRFDFTTPLAGVTRHPSLPDVWGLRNDTTGSWTAVTAAGVVADVAPGRSVTIAPGTRIHFGPVDGVVQH